VFTPVSSPDPFVVVAQQKPRDRLGLRLGASYGAAAGAVYVTARASFLFEWLLQSAVPPGFTSLVDDSRSYSLAGTAGLGLQARRFALQLGYGYVNDRIRTRRPFASDGNVANHLLSLSRLLRS
jgi:hypothetical protein